MSLWCCTSVLSCTIPSVWVDHIDFIAITRISYITWSKNGSLSYCYDDVSCWGNRCRYPPGLQVCYKFYSYTTWAQCTITSGITNRTYSVCTICSPFALNWLLEYFASAIVEAATEAMTAECVIWKWRIFCLFYWLLVNCKPFDADYISVIWSIHSCDNRTQIMQNALQAYVVKPHNVGPIHMPSICYRCILREAKIMDGWQPVRRLQGSQCSLMLPGWI